MIDAMTAVPHASGSPFPYEGPEALRVPIERALQHVVDPEVAMSILDVGLVYGVTVTDTHLRVRVTMTSAACPVTDLILEDIESELERVLPESLDLDVQLVWDPPWSSDRMSARAKAFMGW
jgi:metal-sulfur cluster biosynthetic enzyme